MIDLTIFAIGILFANIIFFIELNGYTNIQKINYLKNSNNIYMSYLLISTLKIISTFVAVFYRITENQTAFQKLFSVLSCLILSPTIFSFFFIFSIGIQFVVFLSLSTNRFQQNTNIKNIVFVLMSLFSIWFIYFLNTSLSTLTFSNETINTIFMSALPLQN